jgi:hypothetical protein
MKILAWVILTLFLSSCAVHTVRFDGVKNEELENRKMADLMAQAGSQEGSRYYSAVADRFKAESERSKSVLEILFDALFYSMLDTSNTVRKSK